MLRPMGKWTDLAAAMLEAAADWARDLDEDDVDRDPVADRPVPTADLNVISAVCPECGTETPNMSRAGCPWCGSQQQPVLRPVAEG